MLSLSLANNKQQMIILRVLMALFLRPGFDPGLQFANRGQVLKPAFLSSWVLSAPPSLLFGPEPTQECNPCHFLEPTLLTLPWAVMYLHRGGEFKESWGI